MKRLSSLVIVLLYLTSYVRSQSITITFEATLNGSPIPLDSILVMNLTAGGDSTIYFPDNVLVLSMVGIGEVGVNRLPTRALPNPFAGGTDVVVDAQGGELLLMLHDALGRELASLRSNVAAGQQHFRVTCERPGVHLLTVVQGGVRRAVRLLATTGNGVSSVATLRRSGITSLKSDRSIFTWTPGDELRYIGYGTSGAVVHSAAIDEVPMASAIRTFVMAAGAGCPSAPSVTDIDGNTYATVQIGSQCWMAENLKTTRYLDGITIPNVIDNTAWTQLNSGAWCNYNNSPGNDATYGKLYNWLAAANPTICPLGWHVPTDAEWQTLEATLGMPAGELGLTGIRGAAQNVGGKMKSISSLWQPPNTGATNESDFSGLPGGFRGSGGGGFNLHGYYAYWWSASESSAETAWGRLLNSNNAAIARGDHLKRTGFCVRCVRD